MMNIYLKILKFDSIVMYLKEVFKLLLNNKPFYKEKNISTLGIKTSKLNEIIIRSNRASNFSI